MAKPEQLKKGVEVSIKRPSHIHAEVLGPRPGDAGLPPEQVTYKVRILPLIQYLPPEDLELVDPSKEPNARLEYMSRDWTQELAHCNGLMQRFLENQNDKNLSNEVSQSLTRLGFFVAR
jgi:hypothetical protein